MTRLKPTRADTAQKEAENKLLAGKELLETLGNNLPDGVLFQFVLEAQTNQMRILYVSGKWEEITGISKETAMSNIEMFHAIIHPEDLSFVMQEVDKSAQNMTDYYVEFRITVQRSVRWLQISSHPHRRGEWIVWDGVMFDITRRKEAARELEIEKMRLQTLGDNLPGSTLYQLARDMRTGQMRILYVSGTWEAVTGVSARHALANITNVFDAVHPDDLPALIQSIEESARTMTDCVHETRFGDRWIHIIARPRRDGVRVVWDGIMTNITGQKNNEAELAKKTQELIQSHQAMRAVLDNIDSHILVTDFEDDQILFANKKTIELFGNIDGQTCWKVIQKGMTDRCPFCPKRHLLNTQNRPTGLYHWEQKNLRNNEWYACSDTVVEWIDGRLVHLEFATNITQQKNDKTE